MTSHRAEVEADVEQWWRWFALALFLLIPLDLFTTLLAVEKYGTAVEANPVMRWLLQQGLIAVTAANLLVVGLSIYLFHVAIERIRHISPSYFPMVTYAVQAWIGSLIVVGIVLVTNNLLVIL